ncbi:MAG: hypothetical protein WCH75_21520 [Candidatus Binatia bacterium]
MAAEHKQEQVPDHINLPAPTAWPLVTAFGLALLAAGLVTEAVVSVVGLILAIRGAVGWFRDVLPVVRHELARVRPLEQRARLIAATPRSVQQLQPGVAGHRVRIPAEIHPYSSGIKGGIIGGIAMAIVACIYGVIAYGSIWYPINLLAAAAVPSLARADLAQLTAFNGAGFIVALISHGIFSVLVGVLLPSCCRCCLRAGPLSGVVSCLRSCGRG